MSGLLGPEKASARLAELQQKIDQYVARAQFAPLASNESFQKALSGFLPADPSNFSIKPGGLSEPLTGTLPGALPNNYASLADAAAAKYNVDPKVFKALVTTESSWNPNSTSGVGAMGLCQLMPSTAKALGVADPYDPASSLEGGAKYLRQMLDEFGGDYTKALAAYNAGPGAVKKANGVPPYQETIAYVHKIQNLAQQVGS